jgi:hypothetical protein
MIALLCERYVFTLMRYRQDMNRVGKAPCNFRLSRNMGGSLPAARVGVTPLILSCLHAPRLCFLLTLFVRPDRFYCLPDSLRTLPLSRYLAALVSTHLTMLTFLFRLRFSRLRCLCLLSSLLDTYTRESSLQILTQTHLLLTKYYTKLLSANYQVADASPY